MEMTTLYHAGPAPLGAIQWSIIPPEYNLLDRDEDGFDEHEKRRRSHARKIIEIFAEMHRTLAAPPAGITSPPPELSESEA